MSRAAWSLIGALFIGVATVLAPLSTTPVTAAPELQRGQQRGLVNVYVNNVLTQNTVAVPVAAEVAAQVCGVTAQVGVVARQVAQTGSFQCTNQTNGDQLLITRNR